jgi:enoyl-CoA hydratase/carnithine racemase
VTGDENDESSPHGRVVWDEHDGVAVATLDRPSRQNALTSEMASELRARLSSASPGTVTVLTGAGAHFCSGFDLGELRAGGNSSAQRADLADTMQAVEDHPWPVVAAVRGNCVGAGFELALACDFRFAGATARFAMPPSMLGIVYPWTGVRRMVETIGPAWSRYMLHTAATLDAETALRIGLVQEVVPNDPVARAREVANVIANKRAPLSIRGAKSAVAAVSRPPVDEGLVAFCDQLVEQALLSADHRAALDARQDGREPRFVGS